MFPTPLKDGRTAARSAWPPLTLAMIVAAALLPAQAQTAVGRPDPTDPQASAPAVRHDSALARYRALKEAPAGSWQQANEAARRAGGWRAYAREKVQADDGPAAPAAAASAVKPNERHDHHAPR
ncbi:MULTISPECIES: hypothetical protein [unclassified Roseateles]|uniref:hypothetical protein n=1 Tax=unclassified Roseateles TaxID=2626991 RepID=UPI000AEB6995|nr:MULTISPECIES: hypothetical protein [unclassified Roseateles]